MSKGQVNITFDRTERVYFGGETVCGTVRVQMQEDTKGMAAVNSVYCPKVISNQFHCILVTGEESAASGSGTNKTTHKHSVVSHRQVLREAGLLVTGEVVDENLEIIFPDTRAFSFEQSDNSIKWSAEVRIDIPKSPDWTKSQALQVVPIEFLGEHAQLADGTTGSGQTSFASEVATTYDIRDDDEDNDHADNQVEEVTIQEVPSLSLTNSPESNDEHPSFSVPTTILELTEQLASADRHNNLRADYFRTAAGEQFDVSIIIDRIVTSIGALNADSAYANGKTVTGMIEGTQQTIEIMTPEASNAKLEGFRRGDLWHATVKIVSWDSLYNRIRAMQLN